MPAGIILGVSTQAVVPSTERSIRRVGSCRQAIFAPGDTANAKEDGGEGHQAPPEQWPGQGDGLPPPAYKQGALGLQEQ